MPTLDWIGKEAVRDHHRQVPYHLLRCDEKLFVGDPGRGNLLVQGDNLLYLKALLPWHDGLKVIYGEGCRIGSALRKHENITFNQVPYEIKVS